MTTIIRDVKLTLDDRRRARLRGYQAVFQATAGQGADYAATAQDPSVDQLLDDFGKLADFDPLSRDEPRQALDAQGAETIRRRTTGGQSRPASWRPASTRLLRWGYQRFITMAFDEAAKARSGSERAPHIHALLTRRARRVQVVDLASGIEQLWVRFPSPAPNRFRDLEGPCGALCQIRSGSVPSRPRAVGLIVARWV
jgi:hypothetical protein